MTIPVSPGMSILNRTWESRAGVEGLVLNCRSQMGKSEKCLLRAAILRGRGFPMFYGEEARNPYDLAQRHLSHHGKVLTGK